MQVTLALSCVLGLTINHSTFMCTRFNDPLTTSVAGSIKNVIMTLIGAVSFGDFQYARWNVIGLGLSMAGAIWYATRAAIKARSHSTTTAMLGCPHAHDPLHAWPGLMTVAWPGLIISICKHAEQARCSEGFEPGQYGSGGVPKRA